MSSIMDELRRLQGKRTPGRPSRSPEASRLLDESGPVNARLADAPGARVPVRPTMADRPSGRPTLLPAGLVVGLVVAVALSVAVLGGRRQKESTPVAVASHQVGPEEVAETDEPVEIAEKPLDTEETVGDTEPVELAAGAEPNQDAEPTEAALVLARLHVVDAIETFDEPRFEVVEPPSREPQDAQPATQPDEQLAQAVDAAPGDAEAAPGPEPVAEATPEAVERAVPEPAEEPLRVLTEAEHEANKTAIRSLKVFGVIADDHGVGVYTSEGELRTGDRFNGMAVTEVTSKYVVFECGNKRYRWMLPRRRARADRKAS